MPSRVQRRATADLGRPAPCGPRLCSAIARAANRVAPVRLRPRCRRCAQTGALSVAAQPVRWSRIAFWIDLPESAAAHASRKASTASSDAGNELNAEETFALITPGCTFVPPIGSGPELAFEAPASALCSAGEIGVVKGEEPPPVKPPPPPPPAAASWAWRIRLAQS